jgi:hypothetical protein
MKTRSMLGLSLGACILLAGSAAIADQGNGKALGKSAPGVQVHIDRQTGRKIPQDDSAVAELAAVQSDNGLEAVATTTGLAVESQLVQINADGSASAKVGLRDMKFAVITIDEDGRRTLTHKSVSELAELEIDHTEDAAEE